MEHRQRLSKQPRDSYEGVRSVFGRAVLVAPCETHDFVCCHSDVALPSKTLDDGDALLIQPSGGFGAQISFEDLARTGAGEWIG